MQWKQFFPFFAAPAALAPLWLLAADAPGISVKTGQAAFLGYKDVTAGTFRKITAADLPAPFATPSAGNGARTVPRPADAWPKPPPASKSTYTPPACTRRARSASPPTAMSSSPKQDGDIKYFRGIGKDGKPQKSAIFATGLMQPFGIGFYPPGPNPQWVYIGNTNSIVRFPYKNGDLTAAGPSQTIVPSLPHGGGHCTRDLAFSLDGKRMFVAVGSGSQPRRSRHATPANSTAPTSSNTPPTANSSALRRRASATPPASESIPPPASSGAPSTSATLSATTSSPTTSPTCRKAASTAGPGITSEAIPTPPRRQAPRTEG